MTVGLTRECLRPCRERRYIRVCDEGSGCFYLGEGNGRPEVVIAYGFMVVGYLDASRVATLTLS